MAAKNPITNALESDGRFIIAEIGSNHNGNIEEAKRLIYEAKVAGADSAKLQFFRARDLLPDSHPEYSIVSQLETPLDWFQELKLFAEELGIALFASVFNKDYAKELIKGDIFALKVASSEIINLPLLAFYSKLEIPLIVSFGMSEWYEVEQAMSVLGRFGKKDIFPLHCVSNYPLAIEDANLNTIASLHDRFGSPVGFSDHTMSVEIGSWAYSFGAKIFEKHITLSRDSKGPDHHYALEPQEFKKYVKLIGDFQKATGNNRKIYSSSEISGRGRLGSYARQDLKPGDILNVESIDLKSPRLGIPSNMLQQFLGSKISKFIKAGQPISLSDIET